MKRLITPLLLLAAALLVAAAWLTDSQEPTLTPEQERLKATTEVAKHIADLMFEKRERVEPASWVEILRFDRKIVQKYRDGMVKVGILVAILSPAGNELEVCIEFLDADGLAIGQFCRSTARTPERFSHRGDTTTFRCTRMLENAKSWANTEAFVRVLP